MKYHLKRSEYKKSSNKYEGKCIHCKSGMQSLCCLQVQNAHLFCSQQNGWIFTIFHQVNCKNDFVIYLLECKKCHIQCVVKAEADFNLRLNNHHKDVYKADAIPALYHFAMKDHVFTRDTSLIIIEQIHKSTLTRWTKKNLLKQRENFWILKLETLKPKGFN